VTEPSQQLGEEHEGAPRPWEERGALRRDREPDRSGTLTFLAVVAVVAAAVSWCFPPVVVPGLLLSIAVLYMARGDLRKMAAGAMDPSGRHLTKQARLLGVLSGVAFLGSLVVWAPFLAGLVRP
jgi:hypothetical protein